MKAWHRCWPYRVRAPHAGFTCAFALLITLCPAPGIASDTPAISRLAFGSCLRQHDPQPIWSAILAARPELFVFMGDNVYGDTSDAATLRAQYAVLGDQPGFRALRAQTGIRAIWDDHDYGRNDGGADFTFKDVSKEIFLDFFGFAPDAVERQRPGLYQSEIFGPAGRRIQLILLDTRYFRSPLRRTLIPSLECPRPHPVPETAPDATILGEAQWQWLERQLEAPAELRVIVSSIQVIPEAHCFEKWANFPHERDRLFRLLARANAHSVLLLSGDRHLAEISRITVPGLDYPLHEITSSGLNSARRGGDEPNPHRLGEGSVRVDNWGLLSIDWDLPDPRIVVEIRDATGATLRALALDLSAIGGRRK